MRYSYCCGKPVRRQEGVTTRGEGYYCDRCKKELTLYGNPKNEIDKIEHKEEMKIKGTGYKVLPNGDLELLGHLVYRNAYKNPNKLAEKPVAERWIVYDKYGKFVANIWLENDNGAFYKVYEPFEKALKKLGLGAIRTSSIEFAVKSAMEIPKGYDLRQVLEKSFGYTFNKNGVVY